jgi:hypothetical protein
MLGEHSPHLGKKVREELIGGRERIEPARVGAGPMPMVVSYVARR